MYQIAIMPKNPRLVMMQDVDLFTDPDNVTETGHDCSNCGGAWILIGALASALSFSWRRRTRSAKYLAPLELAFCGRVAAGGEPCDSLQVVEAEEARGGVEPCLDDESLRFVAESW